MESLNIRTHRCGELRKEHVGQTVTLHGWVHNCRDKSQVIFVVLRDRSGIVQVTIDETCAQELLLEARNLRLEYTVQIQGTVRARDEVAINNQLLLLQQTTTKRPNEIYAVHPPLKVHMDTAWCLPFKTFDLDSHRHLVHLEHAVHLNLNKNLLRSKKFHYVLHACSCVR